eukprot:750634-Hanusia_phi.AAC.4
MRPTPLPSPAHSSPLPCPPASSFPASSSDFTHISSLFLMLAPSFAFSFKRTLAKLLTSQPALRLLPGCFLTCIQYERNPFAKLVVRNTNECLQKITRLFWIRASSSGNRIAYPANIVRIARPAKDHPQAVQHDFVDKFSRRNSSNTEMSTE